MSSERGQRVLVTGSSDGIGKESACELAAAGHRVVVHGRAPERAEAARRQVIERSGNKSVAAAVGDFRSLQAVADMAHDVSARFPDLSLLINNAGVKVNERRETDDGFEMTFQVNYLAPVLLTRLLLPLLRRNAPARVVNVSSMVHSSGRLDFDDLQMTRRFDGFRAYSASKLANLLFNRELARRVPAEEVTANALHPGVIATKLLHASFSGGAPVAEGAEAELYVATAPELDGVTGRYYAGSREREPGRVARDPEIAERLWRHTDEMLSPWLE